jgi:hypothetical protein
MPSPRRADLEIEIVESDWSGEPSSKASVSLLRTFRLHAEQDYEQDGTSPEPKQICMCIKRFVICEMKSPWKRGAQPSRVHSMEARQDITNGRRGPMIAGRMNTCDEGMSLTSSVSPRQDQYRLLAWYYPGYPPPRLLQ